ncbi:MAG: formylglycine-generating enzyme family protein [Candidatus Poribacteria bacterium]|nr:formylglycine-generating enzyme family protein [Candidatus Poribacteria bacterium]
MKTAISLFVFTTIFLFFFTFLGCGSDTGEEDVVEPGPVKFKSAKPENGSTLRPDESIIVYFTATPENLTVEPGTVDGAKSRVTIIGPFSLGDITIELTWADGTQTLEYTVVPEGMVMVREGEFQMGSDSEAAAKDEKPVHTVFVDSFLIDMHEVTVSEYRLFVEETGHPAPEWSQVERYAPTDKHPIVFVSWHDAMAFATWAGKRLPTEAEWEKAARGGSVARTYPWGNISPKGKQCNFADKNLTHYWWSDKKADDGYAFTAPVGSYPKNGYGLFDMAGNVWEWCLDEYDAGFYAVSEGVNPISGANTPQEISESFESVKSNRVLRGGSWIATSANVRNSTRFMLMPESTNYSVGFRCVMDLP